MPGRVRRQTGPERCLSLRSNSAVETVEIGRALGQALRPGDVIVLSGSLGAGKTTLTQGIAAGLGVEDYVTSPTFTLVNEYPPSERHEHPALYHIDLYRTSGAAEALDFGFEEYLGGEGVVVVEWAERAPEAMPAEHLLVKLEMDEDARRLELCPLGSRYAERLAEVERALDRHAAGD